MRVVRDSRVITEWPVDPMSGVDHRDGDVPCWRCGALLDIDWCEVTSWGDVEPRYVRGQTICPTVGCDPCCPTCGGQPERGDRSADIHGPQCGVVMAAKVGSLTPGTVERRDCW